MPKILALGCKTMREGVIASSIFLIAGILLIMAGVHVVPAIWHFQHIIIFIGFLMLLLAPIVLLSTFLLTVLSNPKQSDMDDCEH